MSQPNEAAKRCRVRDIGRAVMVMGLALGLALGLAGCTSLAVPSGPMPMMRTSAASPAPPPHAAAPYAEGRSSQMDGLIAKYAALYNVPEALIRRIIVRESRYNPRARNGPYWGLMQIRYDTAQSMGYTGPASGLLDADTNLRYGVKYLAGAYLVADANPDQAVRNYASGYYYRAKQKGLLAEVGLD